MSGAPPRPGFSPIGIGAESRAPFVLPPDPPGLFGRRAARFAARAEGELAAYLGFLAGLAGAQAACVRDGAPPDAEDVRRAVAHGMPPIDRSGLKHDPVLHATVRRFLQGCAGVAMPEGAAAARLALLGDADRLAARIGDALEDAVPMDDVAGFVFAAAGVQVELAWRAAALPADVLQPVGEGACPCCGGPPVASLVVERAGAHGARFAACAACGAQWNVVRVKCTLCGSTEGIAYHAIEGAIEGAIGRAADGIQAETCDRCGLYAKIMAQNEHPALDPVADDVASLALDLKLAETQWKRGAVNAFLAGY